MKQYLHPEKEKYFTSSIEEEGEITMSRNMNNFTPLPGSWQRGFRSFDDHTFNHRESNEVPVFYRSHSTHATVSLFYYCFNDIIFRT